MKKYLSMLVLGAAALALNGAQAHGNVKPEHGGIVTLVGDTSFELVAQPGGVALYVIDDDEPLASAGLAAKLSILTGAARTEVVLQPAGGNKFEAKDVKLPGGAKVGALVTLANKKKLSASFTIK